MNLPSACEWVNETSVWAISRLDKCYRNVSSSMQMSSFSTNICPSVQTCPHLFNEFTFQNLSDKFQPQKCPQISKLFLKMSPISPKFSNIRNFCWSSHVSERSSLSKNLPRPISKKSLLSSLKSKVQTGAFRDRSTVEHRHTPVWTYRGVLSLSLSLSVSCWVSQASVGLSVNLVSRWRRRETSDCRP